MASADEAEFFESLVANLFAKQGWKVSRQASAGDRGIDIIAEAERTRYVIEVKQAAEGRRDRLVPLLSQAILQVQAAARHFHKAARPVAIVAARHIPNSVAEHVKQFAMQYAEDVGIGIIDSEGFRLFRGFGLEKLNSERAAAHAGWTPPVKSASQLFSNLNQWMLKLLIAPSIPEDLLAAPRERYRNGSQLAQAAGVSVMSASRFIRQLSYEGFIDEDKSLLRLVRVEELMRRWVSANLRYGPDIPARWIIRGGKDQLGSAIGTYFSSQKAEVSKRKISEAPHLRKKFPLLCVGAFAAADLLGFGFAHGVPPHLYLKRVDPVVLNQLGLSLECDERAPDVLIRIQENQEAVFRPVVMRGAVPVSDIVQVWLDVSHESSRGREQADQVWKRVLAPSIKSLQHA
jgi:Holliday junction resolvase